MSILRLPFHKIVSYTFIIIYHHLHDLRFTLKSLPGIFLKSEMVILTRKPSAQVLLDVNCHEIHAFDIIRNALTKKLLGLRILGRRLDHAEKLGY